MFSKLVHFSKYLAVASLFCLSSCEDVVELDSQTASSTLVVDGWLTTDPGTQKIRLTHSAGYFDNSPAKPFLDAQVTVTDDAGNLYQFVDKDNSGVYLWSVSNSDSTLGVVGRTYNLKIVASDDEYYASSKINRVPVIDSISIRHESLSFTPDEGPKDGFLGEFFAKDLPGVGDCYWIKGFRNGKLFKNDPTSIALGYDGAYGPETEADGLILIQPLRTGINRRVLLEDGEEIGVELHGISFEAFTYLKRVRTETSNGGLLAVPPANLPTNVTSKSGKRILGFFGASSISRMSKIVDAATALPKE